MFSVPNELAELVQVRSEKYDLEGFVHGKGPLKPTLLLIGEAPGEQEIIEGLPFIGRAGTELMKSLHSINLSREDVYMTSAVRSRPYIWGEKKERNGTLVKRKYNRAPTMKELVAHAPILDYELVHLQPTLIVTLGNIGLQRLLGKEATVSALHGQYVERSVKYLPNLTTNEWQWTENKFGLIPTFHPASVFYRPSNRAYIEEDWRRIGQWLKQKKQK